MSENRRQILQMLGEGKISADEAERLISAAEESSITKFSQQDSGTGAKGRPKYLRVQVDSEDMNSKEGRQEGPTKVNVRIPMQLLRAGTRNGFLLS